MLPARGFSSLFGIDSTFVTSSAKPDQFPSDGLPEIAFLGRSNVGKSSLINALIGRKGLAFTSNTPGRTQTINFYRINGAAYFVDLPGYGYARVPKELARQWQDLMESYLLTRQTLDLSFLILDARRGWMDQDLELKQWLELHNRRYQVIATKTDKLKSIGTKAGSGADPQGKRRTVAVLGPHGPGSEGNLASDIENTPDAVSTTTPPQEKQDKPVRAPARTACPRQNAAAREPRACPRPNPRTR